MTNADKVRSMTDEEMREYFRKIAFCPPDIDCKSSCYTCDYCWLNWLKKESKEEK